jgi:hypothetical protein
MNRALVEARDTRYRVSPLVLVLWVGVLMGLCSGCVGGRGSVRADRTQFPISFTGALPDGQGRILRIGEGLTPVGTFKHKDSAIGFIYSATPMDIDISEAVELQVRAVQGHGIANFSIGVGHCALNFIFPLNHLPIWPGCATFHLEGTIVRKTLP